MLAELIEAVLIDIFESRLDESVSNFLDLSTFGVVARRQNCFKMVRSKP